MKILLIVSMKINYIENVMKYTCGNEQNGSAQWDMFVCYRLADHDVHSSNTVQPVPCCSRTSDGNMTLP